MNRKHLIGSLALAALFALPSCMVRGSGHAHFSGPSVAVVEVEQEPPPPRVYHATYRPGYVYIDGRWNWRGGQWVWMDGRYERERAGHYWTSGRWERRGNRHVYVEGRWAAGASGGVRHNNGNNGRGNSGPAVRDHRRDKRDDRRDERRDNGPVIRDHRR